jgi:hypothetical protein
MSTKQTEQNLDQVVNSVRKSVEEQRRNSETQPSRKPQSKNIKNIIAIALCIASAALLMYRFEYVVRPNQWPDLQTSPRILQASLATLAEGVEAYKAKNGDYPVDLGLLDFSLGMHDLIAQSKFAYSPESDRFTIDWTVSRWHAKYDSKTQKMDMESTSN